jgi:hypothetical protein
MRRGIPLLLVCSMLHQAALAYEPDITQRRDESVAGQPDHLIPTGKAFPEELPRYYIAKFGRYPSFDQAFEWQLVLHEKDRKYILTSWRLKLDRERQTKSRVEVIEVEVPQSVAATVYEIWANAILRSRYALDGSGLDGTSYSFSTYLRGVGYPGASTWSPQQGPPKVLVDAGEDVLTFGRAKGDADRLLARLRAKSEYLNDYYARIQ